MVLIQSRMPAAAGHRVDESAVFSEKVLIDLLYTDCPAPKQTDNVSNLLVNTVEHLAAKEPDTFLRSW